MVHWQPNWKWWLWIFGIFSCKFWKGFGLFRVAFGQCFNLVRWGPTHMALLPCHWSNILYVLDEKVPSGIWYNRIYRWGLWVSDLDYRVDDGPFADRPLLPLRKKHFLQMEYNEIMKYHADNCWKENIDVQHLGPSINHKILHFLVSLYSSFFFFFTPQMISCNGIEFKK